MTAAAGGERSRLVRALALSRRFHLYLARCASPRAADGLVAALSDELPRLGRPEVHLVRLEPYSGRTEDTPLTDGELAERVLLPLLDPPEDLRGAIHLVDASRAAYADTAAWTRFFALWNEKRNVLGPSRGEVVVMLPAALVPVFASAAPDVWSIRSGEYVIDERGGAFDDGLEAYEPGARSLVGAAPAAASVAGGASARLADTLLLLRAVPPLALFGGDLVVRPWVEDILSVASSSELSAPPSHDRGGPGGVAPAIAAQRQLRRAESALAGRQFDAAEELFSALAQRAESGNAEQAIRALSGLSTVLSVQGRAAEASSHGARALSLISSERGGGEGGARVSPHVIARALRSNALVQWCLGHLAEAEEIDRALNAVDRPMKAQKRSRILRLVERGQAPAAREEMSELLGPVPSFQMDLALERRLGDVASFVVNMELDFLGGDIDGALLGLELFDLFVRGEANAALRKTHASLVDRCGTVSALLAIVAGGHEQASKLLARPRNETSSSSQEIEPEEGFRADAFHAFVSGILEVVKGHPSDASVSFERALRRIAAWGRLGLDFRSRMRAQVAVELLWIMVQPEGDPFLATARDVVSKAETLLGDTEEDHVTRVLAVAAYRELARRLATARAEDARAVAQRAVALVQSLGNLGVPAWDALLHATERSIPGSFS